MAKLKILKNSVPMLDTRQGIRMLGSILEEKGLKMAPTWGDKIKMAPPLRVPKRTGRDADQRRVLPLNGSRWQKLRAQVLAGEPLCRHCAARGLTVPATDVDHISGDPSDNRLEALQPLCHECHSIKTAADHGKRVARPVGLDGLPLSGPWAATAKDREDRSALDRPVPATQSLTAKKERDG